MLGMNTWPTSLILNLKKSMMPMKRSGSNDTRILKAWVKCHLKMVTLVMSPQWTKPSRICSRVQLLVIKQPKTKFTLLSYTTYNQDVWLKLVTVVHSSMTNQCGLNARRLPKKSLLSLMVRKSKLNVYLMRSSLSCHLLFFVTTLILHSSMVLVKWNCCSTMLNFLMTMKQCRLITMLTKTLLCTGLILNSLTLRQKLKLSQVLFTLSLVTRWVHLNDHNLVVTRQ